MSPTRRFALPAMLVAGLALPSAAGAALDGVWHGGGHSVRITGTVQSGFTVTAAESWMVIGCPIPAGTLLSSYKPAGNGTFTATYLWTEATTVQGQDGVQCESSYRSETGISAVQKNRGKTVVISGCSYAYCATLTRDTTDQPKDTKPPRVKAFDRGFTQPGTIAPLRYTVTDDSKRATVHLRLFDGGRKVGSKRLSNIAATGDQRDWHVLLGHRKGPMYYCVWAQDAAGNRSEDAPYSACGWISLIANVDDVSNGCGGAQWGNFWEKVQNFFLDSQKYYGFRVDFRDACNAHDAGYGGFTVKDPVTHRVTDFRTWTRARVDQKFQSDLQTLCSRKIKGDSQKARMARQACQFGPHLSLTMPLADTAGATAYFEGVRTYAKAAFDADPMREGTQDFGSLEAYQQRGERDPN
jgi:hypothetical protein